MRFPKGIGSQWKPQGRFLLDFRSRPFHALSNFAAMYSNALRFSMAQYCSHVVSPPTEIVLNLTLLSLEDAIPKKDRKAVETSV